MNLNYRSCRTSIPRKRRGKHTHTQEIRHYCSIFGEIILKDSCLCRKHEDSMMTARAQLLVPSANREELLKALHDYAHGGGHLGVKKTTEKISGRFYWPR